MNVLSASLPGLPAPGTFSRSSPEPRILRLYPLYLGIGALGYFVEASARTFEGEAKSAHFLLLAQIIIVLSMGPLLGIANCLIRHLYPDGHLWWAASMFGGMFLLCAVMALAMSLQDSLLVVSLAVCATTLWASCAWSASIWALSWTYSWKVAAAWALVAAQALLFFLEPLCGPRGHAHCYEHCPFGAGKHQFFAFDLTLVGLILLGGCQSFDPDAFTERRSPASGPGLEKSDAV
ncbi:unnamed protein product [Effrenium voratum]|uniref:Transmembrane protein n=1 Tax=Effrenium voratum TaxID=2562239 RepID=A0AA36JBI8_9DINO|nr:unnamed protein product [Effrenium voratum]